MTAKTTLKKKNKVVGFILPGQKTFCKVRVIKLMWYWLQDRYIDHWNKIENPEINYTLKVN